MRAVDRDRAKRRTRLEQRRAARRRERLRAETPERRELRQERLLRQVNKGSARMAAMVDGPLPPVAVKPVPRLHEPKPCDCWPPRKHGPHWVLQPEDQELRQAA